MGKDGTICDQSSFSTIKDISILKRNGECHESTTQCHGTVIIVPNKRGIYVASNGCITTLQRHPCIVAACTGNLSRSAYAMYVLRDHGKRTEHNIHDLAHYAHLALKVTESPEDKIHCDILLAGIEYTNGTPVPIIYTVNTEECHYIPAIHGSGSGSKHAMKLFAEKDVCNMTEHDIVTALKLAMLKASKYDKDTGRLIRIKHIDHCGKIRSICKKSVNQIREEQTSKEREKTFEEISGSMLQ